MGFKSGPRQQNEVSGVSCLVGSVNHVLHRLLVIAVLLSHLIKLFTKTTRCQTMYVIVPNKAVCHNICSLSNVHNWTSQDEMAGTFVFLIEVFF